MQVLNNPPEINGHALQVCTTDNKLESLPAELPVEVID